MNTNAKMILTGIVADTPLYLVGPPGGGKTATVEAVARSLGRKLVTVIGATRDRTDFGGWPRYDEKEGRVRLHPFPWVEELLEAGEEGILFLDEMNADHDIFKVLLRILAERYIGEFRFQGYVLGAGNPEELSVSGLVLPPPVANRVIHYSWKVSVGDWVRGMTAGFESLYQLPPLPPKAAVEARIREVSALVAAFIERHPQHLHRPDPNQPHGPWPSPRSWTLLARFVGAARALGMGEEVEALGAYGAVGSAGHEFLHFVNALDLPGPEEVLEDPRRLPERDDALFATLMAVASFVAANMTPKNWRRAWAVLRRVLEEGRGDLAARAARVLVLAYDGVPKEKREEFIKGNEELIRAFGPLLNKMNLLTEGRA